MTGEPPSTQAPAGDIADFFKRLPTSTVHQSRLQLYQPTRRPVYLHREIETPWGMAKVNGKLGQVHADIIEAICRNTEDHRFIEQTGDLQVLVDPYKVRTSVGGGTAYSKDTLWRMMAELRAVTIDLSGNDGSRYIGGILSAVEESPATRHNPLNGKTRQLWRITFQKAFVLLLRNDLHLYYNPAALAKIETGVAQAIARHILTHRDQPNGGWTLDGLIIAVGAGGDSKAMRNRRGEVRRDAHHLKTLNIVIAGDRVYRTEPLAPSISQITHPLSA